TPSSKLLHVQTGTFKLPEAGFGSFYEHNTSACTVGNVAVGFGRRPEYSIGRSKCVYPLRITLSKAAANNHADSSTLRAMLPQNPVWPEVLKCQRKTRNILRAAVVNMGLIHGRKDAREILPQGPGHGCLLACSLCNPRAVLNGCVWRSREASLRTITSG